MQYLVGSEDVSFSSRLSAPYCQNVCDFLNDLSSELMSDSTAKALSDVMSFAFWCRKGNIQKLKTEFHEKEKRLGMGLVFHISPSNVPINFVFSFVFSLLAGNQNIVRVPSKNFLQTEVVCNAIKKILGYDKYCQLAESTIFVRYDQNDEVTGWLSANCNARIIWGGNETINRIRKFELPVRSVDIAFADRYSFCIINGDLISSLSEEKLNRLAVSFYNDTYLMDQNACSSPHLVVWIGNLEILQESKKRFWEKVYEVASKKYDLQPVNAMDKFSQLCSNAIDIKMIKDSKRYENYVYCLGLKDLPPGIDSLRGKFGYFYEYETDDLNKTMQIINNSFQTLTYFGFEKQLLSDFVTVNSLVGIDRIVPIGSALDISVIWDGYDLVRTLSRIIEIK
jgi:hypothetical protein